MRGPPPPPNFSANFFVVKILSDEGDDEYTWQEAWYKLDGTLAVKDGGRYGGTSNPGLDALGSGFTAGDFAFCRSAEAHGGLVFELYPIGSNGDGGGGGTGNCTGDGWRIGLTEDDEWALRVLPDGESIYVEDGVTVTINGVEYTIAFDYAAGTLTLTPLVGSGEPIVGTLDCTKCPCFRFAFKRSDFGLDEIVPHNFCARILYVTACQYCPAGWYCAREAGSDDLFEPLELLEGEACSGTWEIRTGPHETEDEALQHCGSTAGCSIDPRGIVNVFEMDLRGLVTPAPGQCAPGAMCDQWNRVWELAQPFPGDCFWQARPQLDVVDCSGGPLGGNFFARIHRAEAPFYGSPDWYNRLFINFGTATWTYYGSVPGWDGRAPYTFNLVSGPGVGGAPDLYCIMPASVTVTPV